MHAKTVSRAALLALFVLPAITAPALAGPRRDADAGELTPLSGPYIGAFGGYGWTDAETGGPDLDVNGMDYGILGGFLLDAFLQDTLNIGINAALEGHYAWSEADDSVGGIDIEKDHEWGVSLRPGFSALDDVTPWSGRSYAILGWRRAEFEASGGGLSGDEDFDGFELGIGSELIAYDDVGLRLDYTHVFYGEENGIDPDEDDLRLGLVYHF